MKIDFPAPRHMQQQRSLWQTAFGDTDWFLDCFFRTAYTPDRCRCILMDDRIAAILYWIDCTVQDQKLAYIYAVATHPDHRGKGLCRMLMEDTHRLLAQKGYAGAILYPQEEGLRAQGEYIYKACGKDYTKAMAVAKAVGLDARYIQRASDLGYYDRY